MNLTQTELIQAAENLGEMLMEEVTVHDVHNHLEESLGALSEEEAHAIVGMVHSAIVVIP